MARKNKIVTLGGRSAPSLIAKGFYGDSDYELTALVAVSDSGSSTGVIRRNFDMPACGDIRTVITEMADMSGPLNLLRELFEYRFKPSDSPDMHNMAFGNLFITALTKWGEESYGLSNEDSFKNAISLTCKMFNTKGNVYPVTADNVHLSAELEDGRIMVGEVNVRKENKSRIKRIFFKDAKTSAEVEPNTLPECEKAIKEADYIVIGPGGLYCSVLASLCIEGIVDALKQSKAKKIYIANTTTQPGQTDNYTIIDHIREIKKYVDLDYVLLNKYVPDKDVLEIFKSANLNFMVLTDKDIKNIKNMGITPIVKNLIDENKTEPDLTKHKMDTITHDVIKVSQAIKEICRIPCFVKK